MCVSFYPRRFGLSAFEQGAKSGSILTSRYAVRLDAEDRRSARKSGGSHGNFNVRKRSSLPYYAGLAGFFQRLKSSNKEDGRTRE
jgi:hypothetical protein